MASRYSIKSYELIYRYTLQLDYLLNENNITTREQLKYLMDINFEKKLVFSSLLAHIGEMVKHIDSEFKNERPYIQWNAIYRSRNIINHAYDMTDTRFVADIIIKNNSKLTRAMLEKLHRR